jgi:hypothetical protein
MAGRPPERDLANLESDQFAHAQVAVERKEDRQRVVQTPHAGPMEGEDKHDGLRQRRVLHRGL